MLPSATPLAVVGGGGRLGRHYLRTLVARGVAPIAVVRRAETVAGIPGLAEVRVADLRDVEATRRALAGVRHLVSVAHARFTPTLVAAAPADLQRMVLVGSTRKFTRWPDDHGNGVLAGEAAFLASGRPGIMLHPTMIYGGVADDNVQRLARLVRRVPVVPLPSGGRALVQPIHADDVVACLDAALAGPPQAEPPLVVAGAEAMPYHAFVRAVARHAGRRIAIMPLPLPLLLAAAPVTAIVPGVPRIRATEIRRVTEDKAFPTDEMMARLGVRPMTLEQGLSRIAF
ncbi:SDR family oxidoreductase [Zavarzinia sp. CC-PAN008]|uniref:SDR family oxidoreductase n=1 Tax=Zavarzinia sp. CC-PAN008 TaxID=3243332 RepID=UPI003F7483DB